MPASDLLKHMPYIQASSSTRRHGYSLRSRSVVFFVTFGGKLGKGPIHACLADCGVVHVHQRYKRSSFKSHAHHFESCESSSGIPRSSRSVETRMSARLRMRHEVELVEKAEWGH